mmetsp:Transcript_20811/g.23534  ORF Transcript_20811/g.23534 Transcript_20811/m.23534 type:complete len:204 (-) Transcript_20811:296-907(-)
MCMLKSLQSKPDSPPDCTERPCSERKLIIKYFAQYLCSHMQEGFDNATELPIQELFFEKEAEIFSEINAIVDDQDIDFETKVQLLSVPKRKAVQGFLKDLFSFSNVQSEIIIYQFILLKRLLNLTKWSLRATNWRSLVIASLQLAQKIEDDENRLTAKQVNYAYPLLDRDILIRLETSFLTLIDYNVIVRSREFKEQLMDVLL